MKKYRIFCAYLALCVLIVTSCKSKESPIETDLVDGITPVHTWNQDHMQMLQALKDIPDDKKVLYVLKEWPTIKNDIVYQVKVQGYLGHDVQIDSVALYYGSGKGSANDSAREMHTGVFKNRLIAGLLINGSSKPLYFFVECTNGYVIPLDPNDVRLKKLSTFAVGVFTILPTQGLCHHVDYETSINLAEDFGLTVYRGKIQSLNNRISYSTARSLKDKTDQVQVTVHVEAGDVFDLNKETYNGRKKKMVN